MKARSPTSSPTSDSPRRSRSTTRPARPSRRWAACRRTSSRATAATTSRCRSSAAAPATSLQGTTTHRTSRIADCERPTASRRPTTSIPPVGGPIVRARLWFFTSGRWVKNANYVGGMFYNRNAVNPASWTYDPDTDRRGVLRRVTTESQRPPDVAGDAEEQDQRLLRQSEPLPVSEPVGDDCAGSDLARRGRQPALQPARHAVVRLDGAVDQPAARRSAIGHAPRELHLRSRRSSVRQSDQRHRAGRHSSRV